MGVLPPATHTHYLVRKTGCSSPRPRAVAEERGDIDSDQRGFKPYHRLAVVALHHPACTLTGSQAGLHARMQLLRLFTGACSGITILSSIPTQTAVLPARKPGVCHNRDTMRVSWLDTRPVGAVYR